MYLILGTAATNGAMTPSTQLPSNIIIVLLTIVAALNCDYFHSSSDKILLSEKNNPNPLENTDSRNRVRASIP